MIDLLFLWSTGNPHVVWSFWSLKFVQHNGSRVVHGNIVLLVTKVPSYGPELRTSYPHACLQWVCHMWSWLRRLAAPSTTGIAFLASIAVVDSLVKRQVLKPIWLSKWLFPRYRPHVKRLSWAGRSIEFVVFHVRRGSDDVIFSWGHSFRSLCKGLLSLWVVYFYWDENRVVCFHL